MTAPESRFDDGTPVDGINPTEALQVLGHSGPSDPVWRSCRATGLGGSDASAVVGLSRHRTPFEVWLEKTDGPEPSEDSEPAEWGRLLEPVVRDKFARDYGYTINVPGTMRSVQWPWMMTNLDGLVWDVTGEVVGGLEVKTRGFDRDDEWGNDLVADHAEIQAQHNMAVTGLPGFYVVAFLGGYGGFSMVARWVERDNDLIADLVEIERTFWHEHVLAGEMPSLDHTEAATKAITKRYPLAENERLQVTNDTATQVWAARRQAKAAETYAEPYDEVKNRVRQLMGTHQEAYIARPGGEEVPLATWKQTGHLDRKRLRAEHPELHAEYMRKVETFDLEAFKNEQSALYHQLRGRTLLIKKEID